MMNNKYTGARYVPLIMDAWDANIAYEPLTVVLYTDGNSYTSKTYPPKGTIPTNTTYWALTGNYNAQVEAYRTEVTTVNNNVNKMITSEINVKCPPTPLVGAKGDGITDDSSALQAIMDYAKDNGYMGVYFPIGWYVIGTELIIKTNQFSIRGSGMCSSFLKISGTHNGLNLGNYERLTVKDISIHGGGTVLYGTDSISGYGIYANGARSVTIENVWLLYLGNNAIHLDGGCWSWDIKCNIDSIKGDGINIIANNSTQQKNAINISMCSISHTTKANINVWGLNINIENNRLQSSNGAGIEVSSDNVSGSYIATKIFVDKNYFEENKGGCILLKGDLVDANTKYIDNFTIGKNNYFYMLSTWANAGITALVTCKGNGTISSPSIRYLNIEGSEYSTDTLNYFDGNGMLPEYTSICVDNAALVSKYNNIGLAKIITNKKNITVSGYLNAKGINYVLPYSDIFTTLQEIYFPFPLHTSQQYINMGIYVFTDYTNYNVILSVYRRLKNTVDTYTEVLFTQKTALSGSQFVESLPVNSISATDVTNGRISADYDYIIKITVEPVSGGTYVRTGDLNVNYVG
jgi:hypothetical protein